MDWNAQSAPHGQMCQFYFGYLSDAAAALEPMIAALRSAATTAAAGQAKDIAHKIKGNAAMYGYAELGQTANAAEYALASAQSGGDFDDALIAAINLFDHIEETLGGGAHPALNQIHETRIANEAEATNAAKIAPDPQGRQSVLIGYTDKYIADLLKSMLETDYHVLQCRTADAARRIVDEFGPDLIVFEDGLTGTDGAEFFMELCARAGDAPPCVLLAFNCNQPEKMADAISAGISGFTPDHLDILAVAQSVRELMHSPDKTVLIVDDDAAVRDILSHSLKAAGMTVHTACDGIQALEYLASQTPDIIVLDRFMPRLEGGTVLYEIQSKINLKSIPVLVLTAMVNRNEAKTWFARGAADFIAKPFDPQEVTVRIEKHLAKKQNLEMRRYA